MGFSCKVKARVTVRTNIQQLIGGATEETIIARVGEGIVTSIGSSDTYKHVMENPDAISKTVLHKGLDAGTAFEILSIDIADVDVGENIGAKLQADQAESDKRRFQAEAEKRRALAMAHGAGKQGDCAAEPGEGDRGGGADSAGDGGGVPAGAPGDHGLLPHAEHPGGYDDAGEFGERAGGRGEVGRVSG